ncbi:double homeobox B [Rhinolophus ferrumequinum]|uniref:Double homeobox B n=1 Tax=Rhinolophus ferrumequinum TaxID=59479 RepID=A0A7J7SHP7_RHIFE|nr:double homeobox B [Rhinolophus ferrumequinum]
MDLNSTASGILQKETWQGKIVYNQSQKDILQKWFEHNPYPDITTREQLVKETGIPEYNIQNQDKCQNHKEQTGTGALQLKDYCQLHPEYKKHQLQDLGHMDLSYIIQGWDECCQALIAEWDPGKGTH